MPRIAISVERYQLFLDAFLMLGPRFSAVARRVGCEASTARKAWSVGWPDVPYAAPIQKVYASALTRLDSAKKAAEEAAITQVAIKSAPSASNAASAAPQAPTIAALPQTAASILQQSAIDSTQTEVDLLQAFRCNLIGAVTVSNRLLVGFEALAIAAAEHATIAAQNVAQATPDRLLRPLEKFAKIMMLLTQSTKSVIEMQRLLVGAPQQITESRAPDLGDMSERMQRATRVLNQMQRSGLLPPDTQSHSDAAQYDGEESNHPHHGEIVDSVTTPEETLDDSMRSGNDLPTEPMEATK